MRPSATSSGRTSAAAARENARYDTEKPVTPIRLAARTPPGRAKTLIASEAFAKRRMTHQAKADGGDRQAQDPAGDPLEDQRGQHQRETRPKRNHECASCNHGGSQGDHISL